MKPLLGTLTVLVIIAAGFAGSRTKVRSFGLQGVVGHELKDGPGKRLGRLLLQKVTGPWYRDVLLPLSTGHGLLEPHMSAGRHRV